MSGVTHKSAEWIYRGVWRLLVECFKVPDGPPSLAAQQRQGTLRVFHPSRRYLAYMKLFFWAGLVLIDLAILAAWLLLVFQFPVLGMILAVPAFLIAVVPDIIAYIAIHLRYDTIWYGVSNRGIYIRRGIFVITEHTITLENVQNISVTRGPLEQLFGIATVVVETAGSASTEGQDVFAIGNKSIMVGLDRADEVQELLMQRVRASRSAGLGDDIPRNSPSGWSRVDVRILEEIRDAARRLPCPE